MCCNLVTKSTFKIINNGIFSKKGINNGECSTSLPNGENRSLSCGAKKANPNAVLAKEKKAAQEALLKQKIAAREAAIKILHR